MPGSYPDPRSYASEAIQILEEAYEESQGSYAGTLILNAIAALNRLQEEISHASRRKAMEFDQYEIDESNSAV